MWMNEVENISFSWLDGRTYSIKDMKVYPKYEDFIEIQLNEGDSIDEIASRVEVYGEGSEDSSYLIFEANVAQLVDNNFDLTKMHKIRIPATV